MNVLVIGGGVIGLSIARELRLSGVTQITVLDKSAAGSEASWAAAGMLAPNAEAERADDLYKFCETSNEIYPEFVRELSDETGIDIDYRKCGTIEVALTENDAERLSAKFERQKLQGFNVEALNDRDTLRLEPSLSPNVVSGIHYPDDGYVDNRQLVEALRVYLRKNGVEFIENRAAESLSLDGDRIAGAIAGGQALNADLTILATGAWSSLIKIGHRTLPFNVKPIKGQMISFADPALALRKVIIAPGAYLTPRANGRILVGATVEDVAFDKAIGEAAIENLSEAAKRILPILESHQVSDSWCGFRPFAEDGLPIIGEVDGYEDLLVATAHFRNGILLAPLTAKIIADKIAKDIESPYIRAFGPHRFLKSSGAGSI